MNCKALLRRAMIEKRKNLDLKNGEMFSKIIKELDCYKNARTVMLYMPIKGEADVTGLLGDEKVFLTPVTKGDDIYAAILGKTEKGAFGVPEPKDKTVFDKTKIDLVLVPGVAFDKEGNRMGYGKGYYDRFLKNMTSFKIGVCHAFQLTDKLPVEEHDVKMDMIVTESAIWSNVNTL
ncbi:MAG: 5-formyltetrahydrofolate cyclo-ligase [Clostridia bacterium]|nr:5-formyltetrahydrofolate cyclo-ligase [Clostridia bacterium]